MKSINEYYESTAERRTRKMRDIKARFQYLTIQEGLAFMDAYEVVGYEFYLSAHQISLLIAGMNKSVGNRH